MKCDACVYVHVQVCLLSVCFLMAQQSSRGGRTQEERRGFTDAFCVVPCCFFLLLRECGDNLLSVSGCSIPSISPSLNHSPCELFIHTKKKKDPLKEKKDMVFRHNHSTHATVQGKEERDTDHAQETVRGTLRSMCGGTRRTREVIPPLLVPNRVREKRMSDPASVLRFFFALLFLCPLPLFSFYNLLALDWRGWMWVWL
jgi:hypothetical protein